MLMFLLALLYDLQDPPDLINQCKEYMTQEDCLRKSSLFDSSTNQCTWIEEEIRSYCQYNDQQISFISGVYIGVVVSLFTALFFRPIEYMFNIVSATTKQELKMKAAALQAFESAHIVSGAEDDPFLHSNDGVENQSKHDQTIIRLQTRKIPPRLSLVSKEFRKIMVHPSGLTLHRSVQETIIQRHIQREHASTILALSADADIERCDGEINRQVIVRYAQPTTIHPAEPKICNQNLSYAWEEVHRVIIAQRDMLSEEERLEFDNSWEIVKESHSSVSVTEGLAQLLQKLLLVVQQKARQVLSKYSISTVDQEELGIEILQLFVSDLLGGETCPEATILKSKMDEDLERSEAVESSSQYICWVSLIAMNLFFILFTILRGYSRGVQWQQSYLIGCIIQIATEIFFNSTIECCYINVVIPRLIHNKVAKVRKILIDLANKLQQCLEHHTLLSYTDIHATVINVRSSATVAAINPNIRLRKVQNKVLAAHLLDENSTSYSDALPSLSENMIDNVPLGDQHRLFLNVSDYFFLSTVLAKKYSHNLASMIVLSYHSHLLPSDMKQTLLKGRRQKDNASFIYSLSHRTSTLLIVLSASFPNEIHRVIIRIAQPLLLGGLFLLWEELFDNVVFDILFSVIGVGLLIRAGIHYNLKNKIKKQDGRVMPDSVVHKCSSSNDLVLESGRDGVQEDIEQPNLQNDSNSSSLSTSSGLRECFDDMSCYDSEEQFEQMKQDVIEEVSLSSEHHTESSLEDDVLDNFVSKLDSDGNSECNAFHNLSQQPQLNEDSDSKIVSSDSYASSDESK